MTRTLCHKIGCLSKGCAFAFILWYAWCLYVAKFDPWEEQNRYDRRLWSAVEAAGIEVVDFGDGCTLSAEIPVGGNSICVQITYDGPHRPMIVPWLPYNKISIRSTAAYRYNRDFTSLSEWAEKTQSRSQKRQMGRMERRFR